MAARKIRAPRLPAPHEAEATEPASVLWTIRLRPSDVAAIERAASDAGWQPSTWAREVLRMAAARGR